VFYIKPITSVVSIILTLVKILTLACLTS